MDIDRRKVLRLAAGAAAVPALPRASTAQDYPAKPIRLIVGFQPGTAPDVVARLLGRWLSEHLRQPVAVENHAGASGNIAAELVARAAPDGYTLIELTSVNSWNVALFDNLKFDLLRGFAPIASIYRGIGVVVVQPSSPLKALGELIAFAKANPGKLRMGSAGVGTPQHLYGEMFKHLTGTDMLHVPYRGGGRALADLLGGHVDILFDTLVTSIEHIRSNELRPLAVTSRNRAALLPDVPAVAEFVADYEADGWQGIAAPANTPGAIIDMLNRQVNSALADPNFAARIADFGGVPYATSPAEFGSFIAEFTAKWSRVIRAANIKM